MSQAAVRVLTDGPPVPRPHVLVSLRQFPGVQPDLRGACKQLWRQEGLCPLSF